MTIFEKATIGAVNIIQAEHISDYEKAWHEALSKFTTSNETLSKDCPKNTFVDLCSFGFVKGINKKMNRTLSENGRKAIAAIEILNNQNWQFNNKKNFWIENFETSHQSQLDIILALKNEDLLILNNSCEDILK